MRHTKIVATVGPASEDVATIDALIAAGVDVFRLNFSHGTREGHAAALQRIRERAARAGRIIAVMQDLSGPKMRIGQVGPVPVMLRDGQLLRLVAGEVAATEDRLPINAPYLVSHAKPGDRLLVDEGRIELRVVAGENDELVTRVIRGGPLGDRKGINAPGIDLPVSVLTSKDEEDLLFGLSLGVDLVAVSFVQTADDLRDVRTILKRHREGVPLIAKIERPRALENMESILAASDGVMVARGDLGIELPIEQVPRIQKEITHRARQRGIPVIVATQVLESMRTEAIPTRAEVSDAAGSVDDEVDAIMLAGETAVGKYPVRAVQMLAAIIGEAEPGLPAVAARPTIDLDWHGGALAEAAVTLARASGAEAIVAVTRQGRTARMLASLRPRVPIYASIGDESVARRLTLFWGIVPIVSPIDRNLDEVCQEAIRRLVAAKRLRPGAVVVLVRVHPQLDGRDGNFLRLQSAV